MRWRKLGPLFRPEGDLPWMASHAALPVPVQIEGALYRIFFSARDGQKRSHVGFVDVELSPNPRVLRTAREPVLVPGSAGSFDDSGIGIGCIVPDGPQTRLYYMGWNLGVTAPWRNSIGLALGDVVGPEFTRYSPGPILDRSPADPYTISYPWVLRDGPVWHMWYGSNLQWGASSSDMMHVIKHASSDDGISWRPDGRVAVGLGDDGTYALARPCVIKDPDMYRMWYAHRGEAYRIGYAESPDGVNWERRDGDVGIAPSDEGWDSEMICYPCVFDHDGARYMLYNGNGYGLSGFGLAVLQA